VGGIREDYAGIESPPARAINTHPRYAKARRPSHNREKAPGYASLRVLREKREKRENLTG